MATEDDIRRAARQAWGHEFGSAEGNRMKDVTPANVPPPTPKPKPRGVQVQDNVLLGPGHCEVLMPNGLYLAGPDGTAHVVRMENGVMTEECRRLTAEKFQKVHDNFRKFWP